jgi:putative peptidoglycan binding protein
MSALDSASQGSVGSGNYVVKQGECVSSIAYRTGQAWETIWKHPSNSDLKTARTDPNVLMPGDKLFIPPVTQKEISCASDAQHVFVLTSAPVKLRLQLFNEDKPRDGESYRIEVDGHVVSEGKLDDQGRLETSISPSARTARVFVGADQNAIQYVFALGGVDPVTQASGVQQRLNNLGFNCEPSGRFDEHTRRALSIFQELNGLHPTGDCDDATRRKLQECHGC